MLTMFAAPLVAVLPFLVVFALFAWTDRRRRQRHDVEIGQIALIDRIHERFGAVVAPVVRRHRDGWQVRIAVPFDRPALTKTLLEITGQPRGAARRAGAGGLGWESLPCT